VRGPLVIARHGKPALDRTAGPKLGWREYVDWWARYEEGSLAPGQDAPQCLRDAVADAVVHLSSPRPRAVETARLAAPGAVLVTDPVFCEAPLPPPRFSRLKALPKTWNVLARTAWSFGHSLEGSETIAQSRERARAAALRLHEEALRGKVFLAAHGWFNRMLRPELQRLGWRCVADGGDSYWSARVYEYRGRHEKAD
jgi:broad specificity phosphatase PhoE